MQLQSLDHLLSSIFFQKVVLDEEPLDRRVLLEHFKDDLEPILSDIVPTQVEILDRALFLQPFTKLFKSVLSEFTVA